MPTKISTHPRFERKVKKLEKRFPDIDDVLEKLFIQLENDERPGDKIPNIGQDVYKVRLGNPSAQKGKSGGFRVIYYVRLADGVVLLTIYAKSDQPDISPQDIIALLEDLPNGEPDSDE